MKKYSYSLIVKITGIVFIAFAIALGNEIRLGIDRYVKNTLETDAEATKINLDKFSKSYVETLSMQGVDLSSQKFLDIYKDAAGGDSNKIKCLVDKQGHILDISREGQTIPYLGILITQFENEKNIPLYFNLTSLKENELKSLENYLRHHLEGVNYVTLKILDDDIDITDMNELNHIRIQEIKINDKVLVKNSLKGKTKTISGVVSSYENDNLEIYFYNMVIENIKGSSKEKYSQRKATLIDYENMIDGLRKNISSDFQKFISLGSDLAPTNYADYFLIKTYEYNDKYYSTVLLRLIDYSLLDEKKINNAKNEQDVLESLTAGYILVTQEYDDLTMKALKQFMLDNSSTYFLAFIWIGIICLIVAYSIILPIRRIETAAKHIARKDFDYPIDITRHDELGDLSRSIHTMSQELNKTINNLYHEIDRVQKLEQVRKEFVSNFTHEIKTPLGIINGFSELVELEQDEYKRNEYIKIIQGETKRINDLVLAMLDLSHLESQNITLSLESIDLSDIVEETIDSMMYLFEKKNIQLEKDIEPAVIQADHFKIEMVIDNFISNALRYTENGKCIKICVDEHCFTIENEGAHIPSDELEKVWLTFHKVDKARNEEGTGLGLAICKAVLDRHHFDYGVENTKTGVLFYFKY